jgi:hypothetical protein
MARKRLGVPEVKRALDVAREALERDADESRRRGRAAPSPDTASLGMLAAGILIADAINDRAEKGEPTTRGRIRDDVGVRVTASA